MALGIDRDLGVFLIKRCKHGAERPRFFLCFFLPTHLTFEALEHIILTSSEGMRARANKREEE